MVKVKIKIAANSYVEVELAKVTPILKYGDKFYTWNQYMDTPEAEYREAEMSEFKRAECINHS